MVAWKGSAAMPSLGSDAWSLWVPDKRYALSGMTPDVGD
jgi:hypothetical protein